MFAAPRVFVQTRVNGTALNGRRAIGSVPFAIVAANGSPPGSIQAFGGPNVPPGWLLCDGRAISRENSPALYAAIAETFGNGGDGAGPLFNLPDLRGVFIRGAAGLADPGGARAVGSRQDWSTGFPRNGLRTDTTGQHTHSLNNGWAGGWGGGNGGAGRFRVDANNPANAWGWGLSESGSHSHTISGGDAETRPVNVALHYIIKE